MSNEINRMLEDPSEPGLVQELLRAGADHAVTDYDYRQGLTRHLAEVAAGTPLPPWAEGLAKGGTASAGGGVSLKMAALWAGLPIASAGIVAAVMLGGEAPPYDAMTDTPGAEMSGEATLPEAAEEPAEEPALTHDDVEEEAAREQPPLPEQVEREDSVEEAGDQERPPAPARRPRKRSGEAPEVAATMSKEPVNRWAIQTEGEPGPDPAVPDIGEREADLRGDEPGAVDPLQREMQMLASANRLLASDPERALALARAGERQFPDSMFVEERGHLVILALIKLDRMDEARKLAWKYLRRYPKGPFAERVRRALASGKVR